MQYKCFCSEMYSHPHQIPDVMLVLVVCVVALMLVWVVSLFM